MSLNFQNYHVAESQIKSLLANEITFYKLETDKQDDMLKDLKLPAFKIDKVNKEILD